MGIGKKEILYYIMLKNLYMSEWIRRHLRSVNSLQAYLGEQALIFMDLGNLDDAMTLLKEQERICRELGNSDSLQASLGNQANILHSRGDLNNAMALHKEQERIYRDLDKVDGLAYTLINEALILARQSRLNEAISIAEEAYQLASSHGFTTLAKQMSPILKMIREGKSRWFNSVPLQIGLFFLGSFHTFPLILDFF
jgi:tetratricopeptide (TPR) repeat protein